MKFDSKLLAKDVLAKREKDNLTFRAIQKTSGIKPSQLYGIEAGNTIPTCDTLANILTWLNQPVEKYFITQKPKNEKAKQVKNADH